MSSNSKSKRRSKKEEIQANRVVKIIFISLIILGLASMLAFALMS